MSSEPSTSTERSRRRNAEKREIRRAFQLSGDPQRWKARQLRRGVLNGAFGRMKESDFADRAIGTRGRSGRS